MARTDVGMSACPVRRMVGASIPVRASSSWRSRPDMPGRTRSRMRQAGGSGRRRPRKLSADSNVSTWKPSFRNKLPTDSRHETSSSTTQMSERAALSLIDHLDDSPAATHPVEQEDFGLILPKERQRRLFGRRGPVAFGETAPVHADGPPDHMDPGAASGAQRHHSYFARLDAGHPQVH